MEIAFDLFRKEADGQAVWLGCTPDLETARYRLTQLATGLPGEYFVFDQSRQRIVVSVVRLGSDLVQLAAVRMETNAYNDGVCRYLCRFPWSRIERTRYICRR